MGAKSRTPFLLIWSHSWSDREERFSSKQKAENNSTGPRDTWGGAVHGATLMASLQTNGKVFQVSSLNDKKWRLSNWNPAHSAPKFNCAKQHWAKIMSNILLIATGPPCASTHHRNTKSTRGWGLFPTMIFNSHKAKTKESELGISIKVEAVVSF